MKACAYNPFGVVTDDGQTVLRPSLAGFTNSCGISILYGWYSETFQNFSDEDLRKAAATLRKSIIAKVENRLVLASIADYPDTTLNPHVARLLAALKQEGWEEFTNIPGNYGPYTNHLMGFKKGKGLGNEKVD